VHGAIHNHAKTLAGTLWAWHAQKLTKEIHQFNQPKKMQTLSKHAQTAFSLPSCMQLQIPDLSPTMQVLPASVQI
jgi:hypothetical protein